MIKLPALARARRAAIERAADDAAALAHATFGSLNTIEKQVATRLSALEHCEDDAARAEELKTELHTLGENAARLREELSARQARRDAAQKILTRIGSWLDGLSPNLALEPVALPAREPGDESARAACDRYRTVIAGLRAEMDAVRRAPLTRPEVKRQVLGWLDTHARRGRPHIQVDHDKVDVLFENAKALVRGDRLAASLSPDFLVWLFRDELTAALSREVDALTLDKAISRDERAQRLETLRAALLDVERAEEGAIQRAQEEGTFIARRPDADARAVLGIQFVGAASQAA